MYTASGDYLVRRLYRCSSCLVRRAYYFLWSCATYFGGAEPLVFCGAMPLAFGGAVPLAFGGAEPLVFCGAMPLGGASCTSSS